MWLLMYSYVRFEGDRGISLGVVGYHNTLQVTFTDNDKATSTRVCGYSVRLCICVCVCEREWE